MFVRDFGTRIELRPCDLDFIRDVYRITGDTRRRRGVGGDDDIFTELQVVYIAYILLNFIHMYISSPFIATE